MSLQTGLERRVFQLTFSPSPDVIPPGCGSNEQRVMSWSFLFSSSLFLACLYFHFSLTDFLAAPLLSLQPTYNQLLHKNPINYYKKMPHPREKPGVTDPTHPHREITIGDLPAIHRSGALSQASSSGRPVVTVPASPASC